MYSGANQPMFLYDPANGVRIGRAAWHQHYTGISCTYDVTGIASSSISLPSLARTSNRARLAARNGPGLSSDARDAARVLLCLSGSASDENLLRPRAPARRGGEDFSGVSLPAKLLYCPLIACWYSDSAAWNAH